MLGNKGDAQNESALRLTSMEVENTSLFVHVRCVVELRSISHGGRVRGSELLGGLLPFFPSPFSTLIPAFLGFCAFLGFLPIFLGYDPFCIDTGGFLRLIPCLNGQVRCDTAPVGTPNLPPFRPTDNFLRGRLSTNSFNKVFGRLITA